MKIYNYLFYKTYILAIRSKNYNDIPALGGLVFVAACVMFNIFTIALFLEGSGLIEEYPFKKEYKYGFSLLLILVLLAYYMYKGRYKAIVDYYEERYKGKNQIHPVIVIVFYYLISFGLLLLAGMYKNHDWIFAQ